MKKLFLLAGEISGDTHGAGLIRALQDFHGPVQFIGNGGLQMRQTAGEGIEDWLENAAVLGLWEVLKHYGYFKRKMNEALARIAAEQPDAVILIDYPGFNLRLAKALRRAGYDRPIIYYLSPQVWAWKKGRVKTMAKVLDLMICIFPFEKELFEKSGLRTVFAGHPMVDRVHTLRKAWKREADLVGFFPGSRAHEVMRLFPTMLRSARLIRERAPHARFAVSAANEQLARLMRDMAVRAGLNEALSWIEVGSVYDLMQRAQVGVVASGTATLEAACFGLPYALVYKVNPLTYVVGKAVVKIEHLGIVNILAGETVVEEFVQHAFTPQTIADAMIRLLLDDTQRKVLVEKLKEVVAVLGEGGAYKRAADAVAEQLTMKAS